MEIWFYHLQQQPLERALPALLEKSLQRGWRVVVETVDDLRVKALDDLLWSYKDVSFLPHALADDRTAEAQPILVTKGAENANGAVVRFMVDGAEIAAAPSAGYERMILLFDGRNDVELDVARRQWSRLKAEGVALAYWRQTDSGGWERQT